jgi:hypothetical protein
VPNKNGKSQLSDVPPLATVCIVVTTIGLIVALLVEAPIVVTGSLAGLLVALGAYIKKVLS